jgi:hypothetical protein
MADIATNSKRKIATNSTFSEFNARTQGRYKPHIKHTTSRTELSELFVHRTASLDGTEALLDHGDDEALNM